MSPTKSAQWVADISLTTLPRNMLKPIDSFDRLPTISYQKTPTFSVCASTLINLDFWHYTDRVCPTYNGLIIISGRGSKI